MSENQNVNQNNEPKDNIAAGYQIQYNAPLSERNSINSPKDPPIIESQVSDMFQLIKNRSISQNSELKRRHQNELLELTQQYQQIKEQLLIQQKFIDNRDSNEKILQDQLNRATVELAQLRVTRDELNSSFKQATAQIQYLTKELEKIRESGAQNLKELQKENMNLKQTINNYDQEVNAIKNQFQSDEEKLRIERDQLKSQLKLARQHIDQWQDENMKIMNETRALSTQYEIDKVEHARNRQKISELQNKIESMHKNTIQSSQEYEKLHENYVSIQSEKQSLQFEYDKCLSERNMFESDMQAFQEKLKENNAQLQQTEIKAKIAMAKNATLEDELSHARSTIEKVKSQMKKELNDLNQNYLNEQKTNKELLEENSSLKNELKNKCQELEMEKSKRVKSEESEDELKKQILQMDSLYNASEKERFQLSKQIEKLNAEIESKVNTMEQMESQLCQSLKENVHLKEELKDSQTKIASISSMVKIDLLNDANKKLANQIEENEKLNEMNKQLKNELNNIELSKDQLIEEKENLTQSLNELKNALNKEREGLRCSIEERKEIGEKHQQSRQELNNIKRQFSKLQSDFSLLQAEKTHMKELLNQKQEDISSLTAEKYKISDELNRISELYKNEKSARSGLVSDYDLLQKENLSIKKELNESKSNEQILKNKVEIANNLTNKLNKDIDQSKKEIKSLNSKLAEINDQYNEMQCNYSTEQHEKEKFAQKCAAYETQINTNSALLKDMNDQYENTKQMLSETTKELANANINIEKLKDLNSHLNAEIEEMVNEKKKMLQKMNETEKYLREDLSKQKDINSKALDELQNQINLLKNEKNSLEHNTELLDQKLKESTFNNSELKDVIKNLQNEIKNEQKDKQKAENSIFKLQQEISEKTANIQSLTLANKQQTELLNQLKEEKIIMQDQIDFLEHQNKVDKLDLEANHNKNIESLKSKHYTEQTEQSKKEQELKSIISKLEEDKNVLLKDLRKLNRYTTTTLSKLKEITNQSEQVTKQRDDLIKENTSLKTNLISQVNAFNNIEIQLKKITVERNELIEKTQILLQKDDDIKYKAKELIEMQAKLDESVKLANCYKEQMQALEIINHKLKVELEESYRSRDDVNKEFEEIVGVIRTIHSLLQPSSQSDDHHIIDLSTHEQFLRELATLRSLLISSQKEIESFVKQKDQMMMDINAMSKTITKLTEEKTDSINKLEEAKTKIISFEKLIQKLNDASFKYNEERKNLYDGIQKLRNALQLTKEKLSNSESEKKVLKNDKLKMKIFLDQLYDEHKISLQELEKVQ